MKRYSINGLGWNVELNASSIHTAVKEGVKSIIAKKKQEGARGIKSLSVTVSELYPLKKEFYVEVNGVEQNQLGVFDDFHSASIASNSLNKNKWIKNRYVKKGE